MFFFIGGLVVRSKMSQFGPREEGGRLSKKCLNYLSGWVTPNWDNVPNFWGFLFDVDIEYTKR